MAIPNYGRNIGIITAKFDLRAVRHDIFQYDEDLKQFERYENLKVTGINFLK